MKRSPTTLAAVGVTAVLVAGGIVANGQAAQADTAGRITVFAEPSEAYERTMQVGDTQNSPAVAFQATTAADGSLAVTVDPADVPASSYNADESVTLDIQRVDSSGLVGSTTMSLDRDPADAHLWVDPADDEPGARVARHGFRTFHVKLSMGRPHGLVRTRAGRFAATATAPGDDSDPSESAPPWAQLVGSTEVLPPDPSSRGVESCLLQAHAPVWTTIATSYPIENNHSWLDYSSTGTTVSGTAETLGVDTSVFHASSTATTRDAWGENFAQSPYNRSYHIQIDNGLYLCTNTITGYQWWKTAPRFQTGGTETVWLPPTSRPNWTTYCAPVTPGDWSRGVVRGNDYSLGNGVKIAGLIGIDLTSQHAYSVASSLHYLVSGKPKRLCGNNAAPAQASKLILRYQ